MKTSKQTSFDRLVLIRGLDQLLWPLALLVARVLAKLPRTQEQTPVLVRPGGMGDLICVHIAMEQVGLDPRQFVWVIEKRSLPWVTMMGLRHELIGLRLIRFVGKFQTVINTEQHYGASQIIAVALAGRKRRIASFSTVRGAGSTSETICPYNPTHTHEVDSFARLLKMSFRLEVDGLPSQRAQERSAERGLVVVIGGGHSESRSLSASQWEGAIRSWSVQRPVTIISGPLESRIARELAARSPAIWTYRQGSFEENCQVISSAERVLTIDGGMVHVASYFQVPTDALFTSGRELLWHPLAHGSRVFRDPDLSCRPCTLFGHTPKCPLNYECKATIVRFVKSASL